MSNMFNFSHKVVKCAEDYQYFIKGQGHITVHVRAVKIRKDGTCWAEIGSNDFKGKNIRWVRADSSNFLF